MSGYGPQIKIGDFKTSCIITSGVETMDFGVDHDVIIQFRFEDKCKDKIKKGLNVGLYEGLNLVGHGYLK